LHERLSAPSTAPSGLLSVDDPFLVGRHASEPLDPSTARELADVALQDGETSPPAPERRVVEVDPEPYPALYGQGVRRCVVLALPRGRSEGMRIVLGTRSEETPDQASFSEVRRRAQQASRALARIRKNRDDRSRKEAETEGDSTTEAVASLSDPSGGSPHESVEREEEPETAPEPCARDGSPPGPKGGTTEPRGLGIGITDADGAFVYVNAAWGKAFGADEPDALVERSWHAFYDESVVDAFQTEYLPDLRDAGRWRGDVAARSLDGSPLRLTLSLIDLEEGGVVWVGSQIAVPAATDGTEVEHTAANPPMIHRQSVSEIYHPYTNRLETLRTIDQKILAAKSPREIAEVTLQHAQEIVSFRSATVSEIDWEQETVNVLASSNNVLDGPVTLSLDEVYLSDRLRAGRTEVISDQDYKPVPEAERRIREMGLRSILCLPMVVEGDVIGVVHVGRTEPDAFTDEDWEVGRELADHMAIAIRQARLLERVQRDSERLEQKVHERTKELEAFTYSVSHDLRTPLRAVDGFSRKLQVQYANALDEEGQRLLSVVRENAQKMGQLIDDLLVLSRLGRHELRRQPVDMEALAETVVRDLRQNAPQRSVTLTLQSLPPAQADRSMMRRVLENLLSNALKFTQGTADPVIEVGATEKKGRTVYFVRDNGAGFDADYADKMFGVFERLHDESEFSGTGVGLAIVERVVHRHDGRVWAEGAVGEGATVYFCVSCDETA